MPRSRPSAPTSSATAGLRSPVPGLCSRRSLCFEGAALAGKVPIRTSAPRQRHPDLLPLPHPPPRGPRRLPGGVAPGGRPCPAAGLCEVRDVAARARPGGALLEPSPGHGDAAGMRGTLSASPPSLRKCGLALETCSPRKALGTVLVGPAVPGFLRQNRENEREGQGQGKGGGGRARPRSAPGLLRSWAECVGEDKSSRTGRCVAHSEPSRREPGEGEAGAWEAEEETDRRVQNVTLCRDRATWTARCFWGTPCS